MPPTALRSHTVTSETDHNLIAMKHPFKVLAGCVAFGIILAVLSDSSRAQEAPRFTALQALTNREVLLKWSAPTGLSYRLDASTDLVDWAPLTTIATNRSSILHTDSSAPFLGRRFYRALQLTGTNVLTGDYEPTQAGEVVIHPISHATFVIAWNTNALYVDPPQGGTTWFRGLPSPDLILITHSHSDHFDVSTLSAVKGSNTVIIAPKAVYQLLPKALTNVTTVLTNGAATALLGLTIDAVPAYNGNHPKGVGNGYVITIGGRRIYISGDTDDIPEMRALVGVDVAFVCCDGVYNMSVTRAASAVRQFRPSVAYPYHYLTANTTLFKQLVGTDLGIEVRLRKWE